MGINVDKTAILVAVSALSKAHACDGHISAKDALDLAQAIAHDASKGNNSDPYADLKVIRQLITLQAHIIGDLRDHLQDASHLARVDEFMALNKIVRAYVG